MAGHLLGGEVGALAGLFGSQTIGTARAAGLRKIDDLVDRALLDPQFARTLAMKAPDRPNSGADAAVRFQFGRIGRATALGLAAGQSAGPAAAGSTLMTSLGKKARTTGSVLDVLLWDGQIKLHQHAAAIAYAKLRRQAQNLGPARMGNLFPKQHANHQAALRLAGFDRFALDRLAVDGFEPVGNELTGCSPCLIDWRRCFDARCDELSKTIALFLDC